MSVMSNLLETKTTMNMSDLGSIGDMWGMSPMAGMAFLPGWLRLVWVVALAVVVHVHLWHAAAMHGQQRWWHTGHVIMAAGMIAMYAFMMSWPSVMDVTLAVFSVMSAMVIATTVLWWRREGVVNPVWVVAAVDMLVMVYMSLPAWSRPSLLTWLLLAYLGIEALFWTFRVWAWLPVYRASGPAPTAYSSAVAASGGPGAAVPDSGSQGSTPGAASVGLNARVSIDAALSIAVMVASMAYMLAVM